MNLLVVDQHVEFLDILSSVFEDDFSKIWVTGDRHEAFNIFAKKRIDLVLTESNYRLKDGHDMVTLMHRNNPHTPFLLSTKPTNTLAIEKHTGNILYAVVEKPFIFNTLVQISQNLVSHSRLLQEKAQGLHLIKEDSKRHLLIERKESRIIRERSDLLKSLEPPLKF